MILVAIDVAVVSAIGAVIHAYAAGVKLLVLLFNDVTGTAALIVVVVVVVCFLWVTMLLMLCWCQRLLLLAVLLSWLEVSLLSLLLLLICWVCCS